MEGKIVEKLECTPYADSLYMSMKAKSIEKASMPKHRVEQLQVPVNTYKPISDHKHNVSFS
jgi:transcription initiation factor TFIIF subunit beta